MPSRRWFFRRQLLEHAVTRGRQERVAAISADDAEEAMQRPELPKGLPDDIEEKKTRARAWFEELRDQICTSFEDRKSVV